MVLPNILFRQLERERSALNHKLRRQDKFYRQIERETDAMNNQARRQGEIYRLSEQLERESDAVVTRFVARMKYIVN